MRPDIIVRTTTVFYTFGELLTLFGDNLNANDVKYEEWLNKKICCCWEEADRTTLFYSLMTMATVFQTCEFRRLGYSTQYGYNLFARWDNVDASRGGNLRGYVRCRG